MTCHSPLLHLPTAWGQSCPPASAGGASLPLHICPRASQGLLCPTQASACKAGLDPSDQTLLSCRSMSPSQPHITGPQTIFAEQLLHHMGASKEQKTSMPLALQVSLGGLHGQEPGVQFLDCSGVLLGWEMSSGGSLGSQWKVRFNSMSFTCSV